MSFGKLLAEEFLNNNKEVIAIYGGGFKPPTSGHFEVVKKILDKFPIVKKVIIYVGSGERNSITQEESIIIWDIYKKYLSNKVEIIPSKSPIRAIYDYAKENPDTLVKWVVGSREGVDQDILDFRSRTKASTKYENLDAINISTSGEPVSGTAARAAAKKSPKDFYKYLPKELSQEHKEEIYNIVSDVITEKTTLNENQNNINPTDAITVNIPLFIRLLEYAKEDAKTDMDLHSVAENAIELSKNNSVLGMDEYDDIIPQQDTLQENDNVDSTTKINEDVINLFREVTQYCCNDLSIKTPKIGLLNKLDFTQENNSFACYIPDSNQIKVVIKGRSISDSCRSLCHEIFHSYQNSIGKLTPTSGEDGDAIENAANQYSGEIMRHFNRTYPWILTTTIK